MMERRNRRNNYHFLLGHMFLCAALLFKVQTFQTVGHGYNLLFNKNNNNENKDKNKNSGSSNNNDNTNNLYSGHIMRDEVHGRGGVWPGAERLFRSRPQGSLQWDSCGGRHLSRATEIY